MFPKFFHLFLKLLLFHCNMVEIFCLLQLEWSLPQIQGDLVSPRAGHAGITINDSWFIVGGGDNKSGR